MAMTLSELRTWLEDKRLRGVKQVRVTSVEEALPMTLEDALPDEADALRAAREAAKSARRRSGGPKQVEGDLGEQLRANANFDPRTYEVDGKPVEVKGVLVGTREVAAILDVERPRIGRWQSLNMMPQPVAQNASGPLWYRPEIEAYKPAVDARRKSSQGLIGFK